MSIHQIAASIVPVAQIIAALTSWITFGCLLTAYYKQPGEARVKLLIFTAGVAFMCVFSELYVIRNTIN